MTPTCEADTLHLESVDLESVDLGVKDRVAVVAAPRQGLSEAVAKGLATFYIADVALAVDGGIVKGVR